MKSDNNYCIDSSLLITLHHYYPQSFVPSIWDLIGGLFHSNSAFSHRIVFDEFCYRQEHPDALAKWVVPYKDHFLDKTEYQWGLLPKIIKKHPKLIDPGWKKEQADPWIVALLLEEQEKRDDHCVLVTQESKKSADKLPAACKSFGLQSVNMFEFFEENGWKVKVMQNATRGEKR